MDILRALRSVQTDEIYVLFSSALKLVEKALTLYKQQELALSFNAGKDSCVLLHVLRAALAISDNVRENGSEQNGNIAGGLGAIKCFMFSQEDEFEEIREFSVEMDRKYGLNIAYLDCPMKSNLKTFVEAHGIKAVMLGTRRGDPNAAGQSFFSPTSDDWPPLMRINPILDWSYQNVWAFLLKANAPYCGLYNVGYTSIGGVSTTLPNSSLRKENGTYAPAFLLSDSRLERIGRRNSRSAPAVECAAWTRKAALLIIGNELLSGKVEDVNVVYLCRELRSLGWIVNKVSFVGDDVPVIAEEVNALASSHDMVLTAGGVGPTVDDVTMQGVAVAMKTAVARHPYLVKLIRDFFEEDVTEAHLKMTEVPRDDVEFIETYDVNGNPSPFPLVQCRNVYMLPGVPEYLRTRWKSLKQKLIDEETLPPFHNIVLRLKLSNETEIAPALDAVTQEMGPAIQIGSYPVKQQPDGATVLVCLESKVAPDVQHASKIFRSLLSPEMMLSHTEHVKKWSHSRKSMQDLLGIPGYSPRVE